MSIKRYISTKDNTITNAFKSNLATRAESANMGSSDILEVFSIYGQANSSSLEKMRVLVNFPIDKIYADRQAAKIPASGSVRFRLVLSNAEHGQSTPEKYTVGVAPLLRDWEEGYGMDMESFLDVGGSNWISASSGSSWHSEGSDYRDPNISLYSAIPAYYTKYLEKGVENVDIDITGMVEEWTKSKADTMTSATASIVFPADISRFSGSTLTLYSHEGQKGIFKFIRGLPGAESTASVGVTHMVPTGSSTAQLMQNLYNKISTVFSSKIVGQIESNIRLLTLTQSSGGFFGNTVITSSVHETGSISIAAGNIGNGDKFEIKIGLYF